MQMCTCTLGRAGPLTLFSSPTAENLTVANYYDQFVPRVTRATPFFTWMTSVMLATAVIMAVSEWDHRLWAPVVVLVGARRLQRPRSSGSCR
jgi:hypothetical protein